MALGQKHVADNHQGVVAVSLDPFQDAGIASADGMLAAETSLAKQILLGPDQAAIVIDGLRVVVFDAAGVDRIFPAEGPVGVDICPGCITGSLIRRNETHQLYGCSPALGQLDNLLVVLGLGIKAFLNPEDIGLSHGALDFMTALELGKDFRDFVRNCDC